MMRCINSVAPLNGLLRGGRTIRSWLLRVFRRRRGWARRPRGGPLGMPPAQRAAAALQQLLASVDAPGLALLLAKNVAAAAASAGFEGLWVALWLGGSGSLLWAFQRCCC